MRLLLSCLVFVAAPFAQSPCSIRGAVVDALSMRPLAGAEVFADPQGDSALPMRRISDSKGEFCFEGLAPGDYALEATRARYLSAKYGEKRAGGAGLVLHVGGGAPLTLTPINMAPQAVISGLVLDEEGEPLQDGKVSLLRSRWVNGKLQPASVGQTVTDDRGRYRFAGLLAGSYFLMVRPIGKSEGILDRAFLDQAGQPFRQIEVSTFYRGSPSFRGATPIRLSAGQQLTDLPLTMTRTASRHVSGHVPPEVLNSSARNLYLMGADNGEARFVTRVKTQSDGSFLADGLAPGRYLLKGPGVKQELDLTSGDADGLSPAYLTPVKVSIAVDGAQCSPLQSVRLEPGKDDIDPADQAVEAKAAAANKFESVVWPGRFRIAVTAAGPACFIKRLLVDGVARSPHSFEIGNGTTSSIDVLLSSAVASIDGQVRGERSTLLLDNEVEPDLSKEQVADADGKFRWNSLEPGRYRLYAFEDFDREEWGNPALALLLAAKMVEIEVKESEHAHVVVPLISVADFADALAKLPR